ncbi:MAG: hypothetical protein HY910_06505 [Desulfarculus sp.]|nr:hypothetical protein [Desulfarculus sp.]
MSGPRPQHRAWPLALGLALAILGLAVAQTLPLARDFTGCIPYTYQPSPGHERFPLIPGDHLQFLYWLWLLADNVLGPSALFSNPYEFSTFITPHGLPGYPNFPFSAAYLAFWPLGMVTAYNCLLLLSYVLGGLCAWALAREVLQDELSALLAGLSFALLPYRAAQVMVGHLYGFVAFMLPFTLWCLERGWRRRSWAWGAAGGLCLVAMAVQDEGHLIFYTALLLGLYVPIGLLLRAEPAAPPAQAAPAPQAGRWPDWAGALGCGLGLGLAAQAGLKPAGAAFTDGLAPVLAAYLLLALALWLLLARLLTAVTMLDLAAARRLLGRGLLPWGLLALHALPFWRGVPYLTRAVVIILGLWSAYLLLPALWRARRLPRLTAGLWRPVLPLLAGLGLAVAWMLHLKLKSQAGSVVGKGRSLAEVRLHSPGLSDLFSSANHNADQLIYLGLPVMALALVAILLLVFTRPGRLAQAGRAALWIFLGLLTALLSLGPSLPQVPVYEFLYRYLPFFNYPRVTGRLALFAALFLALAAGWALRRICAGLRGRRTARWAVALGLMAAVAWDTWPATPPGLCLIPPDGRVETAIRETLPTGPAAPARLLGLPIWPGDSHQSSVYELLISRTRALVVNGYSPWTPRAYVERIFQPLYSLDFGQVTPEALDTLRELRVRQVVFYEDQQVYTRKVSPFPPELARRRLIAAGLLRPMAQEGQAFLLGINPDAGPAGEAAARAEVSPVTVLFEAENLHRQTGRLVDDPAASGWGLMFKAQAAPMAPLGPRNPRAGGNVASAKAGLDAPGFLCFGPYQAFPPGDYLARFRLRRGGGSESPGRVEIAADQGRVLVASAELATELLPADGAWHDLALPFSLAEPQRLETRVWYSGADDLSADVVLVNFAGQERPAAFYPAAKLWRQTGDLEPDARVPGGWAAVARAGYHPPVYLMHGPQQTYPPGRYRARFRLAAEGDNPPQAELAEVVVACDLGRRPLGHVLVRGADLTADYRDVNVDFSLDRRAELGLRVLYRGGGSLKVAGVAVETLP